MPLHIIKLVVGLDTPAELLAWRREREAHERDWRVQTRMTPRRAAEVEDGGSIYRVFKGVIAVRQRILAVETVGEGRASRCHFVVEPLLVAVVPTARRPFQGWRYLEAKDAPADLSTAGEAAAHMPADLIARLREIGAW